MLTDRRLCPGSGVAVRLAGGGRTRGRAVLVLHGEDGPSSVTTTVAHLCVEHRVTAPVHPGWAGTERAPSLSSVGALARAHLDVLETVDSFLAAPLVPAA